MLLRKCAFCVLAVWSTLFFGTTVAQEYPAKTVRIIVPANPGGGTDYLARLLAQRFQQSMGQAFVVENRAGADGMIGAAFTAKSAPDGYTLLLETSSLATNATLHKQPGLDPVKDLAPLALLAVAPLYLVVHPSVPAKSVKELVALARSNPGKLNASSPSTGSISHMVLEFFKQSAGLDFVRIPYSGGAPQLNALLSGTVEFSFLAGIGLAPLQQSGRLRVLAITTAKRSSAFPDVPSMSEFYPGFDAANWYALFVPAGTPAAVITKLHSEAIKVLNSTETQAQLAAHGIQTAGSTPQEMSEYFKREVDRAAQIIRAGKLTLN